MIHTVKGVEKLHVIAKDLYGNTVVSGESSADAILFNLQSGIENLKSNWKGKDAGVRIQEVIKVYNAMVKIRNDLALIAGDSTKAAIYYRELQNAAGAGMDELNVLNYEDKTIMADYSDTADIVDINSDVLTGKNYIDTANNLMDKFSVDVNTACEEILDTWVAGPGRDNAVKVFDEFSTSINSFKQVLSEVSANINTAVQNYIQ